MATGDGKTALSPLREGVCDTTRQARTFVCVMPYPLSGAKVLRCVPSWSFLSKAVMRARS